MKQMAFDHLFNSIRHVVDVYSKRGRVIIPLYGTSDRFDADFARGTQIGYEAALSSIPVVHPGDLSMEQVLEFREDPEAVRQYRSLRIWLREGLRANSVTQASDIILQKLEAYEWAIRKHGLTTLIGSIFSVLDSKTVVSIASGAALTALISRPAWAGLTAGLLAGARSLAWIAERQLDLEDTKRGENSEVALFYTLKKRFPKRRRLRWKRDE